MNDWALVVLGPGGMEVAEKVKSTYHHAKIHALKKRIVRGVDIGFDDVGNHLRMLFSSGTPIIGVCATGILIRSLSTSLNSKNVDPPVIALSEDGKAIIPLLGGHKGANEIAGQIAALFGISAAITTASDARFGIALDAPPKGWKLANPPDVGPFVADLLAGETVRLDDSLPYFVRETNIPIDLGGILQISSTINRRTGTKRHLVYHPLSVAIGVGCERNTDQDELIALVESTLQAADIAPAAIAGVFSLDLKADEPAVHAVAEHFSTIPRFFDVELLEKETPRLENPSDIVYRSVGCHGVAEAAALAAVGADGHLIVGKQKSARSTCALALAPKPFSASSVGKCQGRLFVLGIGPGGSGWLTNEAEAVIDASTDFVGYGLYLDLLGGRLKEKVRHDFALGEETTRVQKALDIAGTGKTVALVSSGDPGIYAMATLAFQLLETQGRVEWKHIEIIVCPGISALQAAAARVGAPLGHDFCTISLSDLLTPWDLIEGRLHAAVKGDFVIAFYNPVSKTRTSQLVKALRILLNSRPSTTPVIIARNLGRKGERVRTLTLGELDPSEVDMLTVVLVGSSQTRSIKRSDGGDWIYTPRGYQNGASGTTKEKA
jgi:cobalt-precorrin 5A hydrolase/precorrin-3B C17-methyltransferase